MPRNKLAWRRGIFVVLIIVSLALLTVSFRESESGPVHAVRQAAASLISPLQSWGATIAKPFQDGYEWFRTLWSAHERAEELEQRLQVLEGELVMLQEEAEENERLRSLLDLRDKTVYPEGTEFQMARVIGKSPTLWEAWVLIDRGSADGLSVGLPVVGATPMVGETLLGKGLVGKIVAVTAHTAQVLLITDSESSVASKIQGSRAEGIVRGSVNGDLKMDYVDRDLAVDPKLVVVTSGYGGVYPPDIPVGIVSSVGEETINIYKEIDVQAFVDFRVLEEVMVVLVPQPATQSSSPAGAPASSVIPSATATTIPTATDTTAPSATGTTTPSGTGTVTPSTDAGLTTPTTLESEER